MYDALDTEVLKRDEINDPMAGTLRVKLFKVDVVQE